MNPLGEQMTLNDDAKTTPAASLMDENDDRATSDWGSTAGEIDASPSNNQRTAQMSAAWGS
jgi:hypothetical protein